MKTSENFTRLGLPFRLTFILTGIASTIWFLIKVIPKPTRATYPCMQAAAPIMSGFIIWLIGLSASALAFRKAKIWFLRAKFLPAMAMAGAAIVFCLMFSLKTNKKSSALPFINQALHKAKHHIGEEKG